MEVGGFLRLASARKALSDEGNAGPFGFRRFSQNQYLEVIQTTFAACLSFYDYLEVP
jgi:hypothetical protein